MGAQSSIAEIRSESFGPRRIVKGPVPCRLSDVAGGDVVLRGRAPRLLVEARGVSYGANTFAMRDSECELLHSATLDQLLETIRGEDISVIDLEISLDGGEWMTFDEFSTLTELDVLSASAPLPVGSFYAPLDNTSVVAVFGKVREHRATGRLIITVPGREHAVRTQIDFHCGAPTWIASSENSLELESQIIRHELLDRDRVRSAMYRSIRSHTPLSHVLRAEHALDMDPWLERFTTERLELIVGASHGTYAFVSTEPSRTHPISRSPLRMLRSAVDEGMSVARLQKKLERCLTQKFFRTRRFDALLPELGLNQVEQFAVAAFGRSETLAEAISPLSDESFALSVAHLFIELKMIEPVVR